ncbi:MAG TPA: FAD binding domain-containing protein, partial [Candidatus Acidoferrales bacterium]
MENGSAEQVGFLYFPFSIFRFPFSEMRPRIPHYELVAPPTLHEALALLAHEPGAWRPFAGGTDLMVLLEAGKLEHRRYFSIWHLSELKGIEETSGHVTLGALTTYSEVLASDILRREFPMLCAAARETGGIATQNRGTLGGNIVNASPAADSPPALLVYDAELELVSTSSSRWAPYNGFHTGYKQMNMRPDELLRRIRLPRTFAPAAVGALLAAPHSSQKQQPGWRHYYRKVGTRKAQAISKVCFAGLLQLEGGAIRDARIAFGSVAPIPLRCVK